MSQYRLQLALPCRVHITYVCSQRLVVSIWFSYLRWSLPKHVHSRSIDNCLQFHFHRLVNISKIRLDFCFFIDCLLSIHATAWSASAYFYGYSIACFSSLKILILVAIYRCADICICLISHWKCDHKIVCRRWVFLASLILYINRRVMPDQCIVLLFCYFPDIFALNRRGSRHFRPIEMLFAWR